MLLRDQISDLSNEIASRRMELDRLLDCEGKTSQEWAMIRVMEDKVTALERDLDRARRWLSSCGVTV